jgi:hypothetical protein
MSSLEGGTPGLCRSLLWRCRACIFSPPRGELGDSGRKKGWLLVAQAGQRRSARVLIDVPVVIRGESADQQAFREETFTVTVSAHGALLMLATNVVLGQQIVVINQLNRDEREGRVAYRGPLHAGLSQVAVEFTQPSPEFWPVSPAPVDWNKT